MNTSNYSPINGVVLRNQNQISWIRRRDWHILSSGAQMYTNDERFAILHTPGSNTWTLQIKFVQRRDHGTYECQVSTAFSLFCLKWCLFVGYETNVTGVWLSNKYIQSR
uniref:IGv domain-containing protein n=1 Tax=Anopheles melas TaxID=34690 RepID=A0A182TRE5_9DIPT